MSQKRYQQLLPEKDIFLERARKASELTLPLVIRKEGHHSSTTYKTPYQSVGSRGVTNLASNLMLSLFPASQPFFRLLVSDSDFEQFGDQASLVKEEVNESLSQMEKAVLEEIESKNLRPVLFEVFKNLLIAGNSLVYVEPEGSIRNYTLEDYVVHRDISGTITDIIIREFVHPSSAQGLDLEVPLPSDSYKKDQEIELHTCVKLKEDGKYEVYQEIKGERVKNTYQEFDADKLPWLPLRLSKITGESYGRGYVEGVIGDLQSLEALSQAVVEAAAMSAKTVFMVNPGSTTRPRDLVRANNGDVISGAASDVTTLQVAKGGDLSIALQTANKIETRLSYSFNLLEATLPTSGQTTATEINAIINSLEKVLAGVFSMLASEFMQPLVKLIIHNLGKEEIIPTLPEQVKLVISTGISGLGRTSDIERIAQFTSLASQVAPESYMALTDFESVLRQLESAVGVDVLKSKETLMQEQQAAQQQAMMQQQAQMQAQMMQQGSQATQEMSPEEMAMIEAAMTQAQG